MTFPFPTFCPSSLAPAEATYVTFGGTSSNTASPSVSINLGTPPAGVNRYVIAAGFVEVGSLTVSSLTLDGDAATAIGTITNDGDRFGQFFIVDSDATGSVTVAASLSGGVSDNTAFIVWRLNDFFDQFDYTPSAQGNVTNPSTTIDVRKDGCVIAAFFGGEGPTAGAVTWTGATEDVDVTSESFFTSSGAHQNALSAETGRTIQVSSPLNWNDVVLLVLSF